MSKTSWPNNLLSLHLCRACTEMTTNQPFPNVGNSWAIWQLQDVFSHFCSSNFLQASKGSLFDHQGVLPSPPFSRLRGPHSQLQPIHPRADLLGGEGPTVKPSRFFRGKLGLFGWFLKKIRVFPKSSMNPLKNRIFQPFFWNILFGVLRFPPILGNTQKSMMWSWHWLMKSQTSLGSHVIPYPEKSHSDQNFLFPQNPTKKHNSVDHNTDRKNPAVFWRKCLVVLPRSGKKSEVLDLFAKGWECQKVQKNPSYADPVTSGSSQTCKQMPPTQTWHY